MRRTRLLPPDPEDAAGLEVEHHLAELVDRLVQDGMEAEEAHREAERRFGDPARYRAALEADERRRRRTMRRMEWWGVFSGGVGRTVRSLRRDPGFALGVVLTLALGIGANAAMFGVLDRILFQPSPHVVDPDGVRRVMVERPLLGRMYRSGGMTYPDFVDIQNSGAFQDLAAVRNWGLETLGSGPDATQVETSMVSWNFFRLLGIRAERGRLFTAEDDRDDATPTAMVSHEYWQGKMGGDPGVVGRTVVLAGDSYTIIGVTPAGFTGVGLSPVDVWLPIVTSGIRQLGREWFVSRRRHWFSTVARLDARADTAVAAAKATATLVNGHREDIEQGRYSGEAHIELDPLVQARGPQASGESRVACWLGGVSLLVLLIACANVANLFLARGTRSRREMAVRLALGVGRARLVSTMMVESVLLALLGGGVALALAMWAGGLIRRTLLPGVFFPGPAVGARVVGFTVAAALVAGLVAGIGPALQATRAALANDLAMGAGSGAGRRSRTRALLTVAQAALSVVLLVGAGLFVRSVHAVRHLDLGLDLDRLVMASLEFETRAMTSESDARTASDQGRTGGHADRDIWGQGQVAERNAVYSHALERLRAVPGVESVAGTNSPFGWAVPLGFTVQGRDSLPPLPSGGPYFMDVTPEYLRTVGLRITRGRDLEPGDDTGASHVVVISETLARTFWSDADPLGACLIIEGEQACTTVVGVAEDASQGDDLRGAPYPVLYLPLAQHVDGAMNGLYVRTADEPSRLAAVIAPILRELDPRVRYANVAPLREQIDSQARSWTLGATMFTVFGLLALTVAAIGLYAVLAFDVAQRTRELGILTALGAERPRLLMSVVVDGIRLAAAGVVAGIAIALAVAPHIRDLLFEGSPRDPQVLAGVAGVLLLVALAASLIPALRATRVDPMEALRVE
jgi:ABC-type lipoprotein release transport system permease subunit